MKVLDAEFVQGFIRMADDGWQQGWHERNGGNLSYRMKPEEIQMVKEVPDRRAGSDTGRHVFSGNRERKVLPECEREAGRLHLYHRAG